MSDWGLGYVTDVPYLSRYYGEATTSNLWFAAACAGAEVATRASATVLELGTGMGLGLVLSAAAAPQINFEGVDFNPAHVAHARELIDKAGLKNIVIHESSFQDLAHDANEFTQDVDIVILKGIMSWVSADSLRAVVEICRKRLRPGGLVYVSYNCLPGWAHILPLRQLMCEAAKGSTGTSMDAAKRAIDFIKFMRSEMGRDIGESQKMAVFLDKLEHEPLEYIAHEYLNNDWRTFNFNEVADLFRHAKVEFAGSARIIESLKLHLKSLRTSQNGPYTSSAALDEVLGDFRSKKATRRDIFIRGLRRSTPRDRDDFIGKTRFISVVSRSAMSASDPTIWADNGVEISLLNREKFAEALCNGPVEGRELQSILGLSGATMDSVASLLGKLIDLSRVHPIIGGDAIDFTPARRLNRVISKHALAGRKYSYLASPNSMSAVNVGEVEMKVLSAILDEDVDTTERGPEFQIAASHLEFDSIELWRRLGCL